MRHNLISFSRATSMLNFVSAVGVAQLVERRSVAPNVAGSIPVSHPNFTSMSFDRQLDILVAILTAALAFLAGIFLGDLALAISASISGCVVVAGLLLRRGLMRVSDFLA
jgi:hypothetical protein